MKAISITSVALAHQRIIILIGFLNLLFAGLLSAAPGDLDTSFAGTGRTRLGFEFGQDIAYATTMQPDGKLVVAGSSGLNDFDGRNISIVRYDTNNLLDKSFGNAGKVITPVFANPGLTAYAFAEAVRVQPDGRIVVAGEAYDGTTFNFLVARYNGDGSPDNSFGTNGIVLTGFGQRAAAHSLAIQPDGKIVVAGSLHVPDGTPDSFALVRYLTNGVLDSTFGGTGKVTDVAGGDAGASGVVLQADGKIVATGTGGGNFATLRFTTNGLLDTTFGGTGRVFTHLGPNGALNQPNAIAIQPGDSVQTLDKIVIAGFFDISTPGSPFHFAFGVIRYNLSGSLDSSFGGSGIVPLTLGPGDSQANALLVQGTGAEPRKIIVAGSTFNGVNNDFCLLRYNDNGGLDNSFNGDGIVTTSFGPGDDAALGMTLVTGNKLIVVGSTFVNNGNTDYAMARYNLSDGTLDASFNGNGKMTQDIFERTSQAKGLALQADGKMVLAGSAFNGSNDVFVLSRFSRDGTPDGSFGKFGKVIVPFNGVDSGANAVAIQTDGKIVAAGSSGNNFAIARFDTNGVLDTTFDGDGVVTTSFAPGSQDSASALVLQPDGKIVVVGDSFNGANDDFAIARYNTNGTPDLSFGTNGRQITAIDTNSDAATAVKLQSDGKIVVSGYGVVGGGFRSGFAAVRYLTNGMLDNSFGTFGRVATDLDSGGALGTALAIQPDGRILVSGYTANGFNVDFGLVRYLTNGMLDASFDGDGKVTTPIGIGNDLGLAMALQGDGKIIVAGAVTIGAHPEFVAARYTTNGSLDNAYGLGGKAVVDFADNGDNIGNALALDSLGRAVIAGSAGGLFGVARLQGDPYLKIVSIARATNGHALLTGVGLPNANHTVQGAPNMLPGSFSNLGTTTADGAGLWQYEDATATNLPGRFYRLVLP